MSVSSKNILYILFLLNLSDTPILRQKPKFLGQLMPFCPSASDILGGKQNCSIVGSWVAM